MVNIGHSVGESSFTAVQVEAARIVSVNIKDWSVDAVTLLGNKVYEGIQVSSPYLHFVNGEGMYAMPEVGSTCWVCKPSTGTAAAAFILGFSAPTDEREDADGSVGEFKVGRQNLNPGDIMLRTRDENFMILRRGGVLQLGATPIAQRLYLPIGNVIRDMCENYGLFTLGGELTWTVERAETTISGDAPTQLALKVKQAANEAEHIATVTLGSHTDDDDLVLSLRIAASGDVGAETTIDLKMTKDGGIVWAVKKNYEMTTQGDISLSSGQRLTLSGGTSTSISAIQGLEITSGATGTTIQSAGPISIVGSAVTITAPITLAGSVTMGPPGPGPGGTGGAGEPLVKGDSLVLFLRNLIDVIIAAPQTPSGTIGATCPPLALIKASLSSITTNSGKIN